MFILKNRTNKEACLYFQRKTTVASCLLYFEMMLVLTATHPHCNFELVLPKRVGKGFLWMLTSFGERILGFTKSVWASVKVFFVICMSSMYAIT